MLGRERDKRGGDNDREREREESWYSELCGVSYVGSHTRSNGVNLTLRFRQTDSTADGIFQDILMVCCALIQLKTLELNCGFLVDSTTWEQLHTTRWAAGPF
jgi:hypothetical protein